MFSVARLRENRKMQPRAARIIFRLSGGGGRVKLWMVRILAKQFRPCFFFRKHFAEILRGRFFQNASGLLPPSPEFGEGFAREFAREFARGQGDRFLLFRPFFPSAIRPLPAPSGGRRRRPRPPHFRPSGGAAFRRAPPLASRQSSARALPLSPAVWRRRGRAASDGRDATFRRLRPAPPPAVRLRGARNAGQVARSRRRGAFAVRYRRREAGEREWTIRQVHSPPAVHSPSVIGGGKGRR